MTKSPDSGRELQLPWDKDVPSQAPDVLGSGEPKAYDLEEYFKFLDEVLPAQLPPSTSTMVDRVFEL